MEHESILRKNMVKEMISNVENESRSIFNKDSGFNALFSKANEHKTLKKSRSVQNLDVAVKVATKGSRSHSLHRKSDKGCFKSCCKAIFNRNVKSEVDYNNIFVSRRYLEWDNHQKLQTSEISQTVPRKMSGDPSPGEKMSNIDKKLDSDILNEIPLDKVGFKSLFTIFLKRSSIYPLNQIGNSTSIIRRIFWSCIMILGLIGSGYQVIQYLRAYFAYPVVVNMDSIYSMDQVFPAVTVCNLNRVRKEFTPCLSQKAGMKECNTSHVYNVQKEFPVDFDLNGTVCTADFKSMSALTTARYMWRNLYISLDPDSQKFYGHQKESFIRSCSFNGEVCTPSNFSETINIDYGNCFTFNKADDSKSPLKTPFVGPNGGLELELDLEVEKYSEYTTAVGARVQVHDPYHEENSEEEGINVSPGFETSIALSRFEMLRLPKPYKDNCKTYPIGESPRSCNENCMNNITLQNCSCTLSGTEERHCDFTKISDICCVYSLNGWKCTCPLSCNSTFYKINIFSAVWPSSSFNGANPINDTKGNVMSLEAVRDARLKLKVYYDTLETIKYQQNPMYQNSEVFSQIGGQMGLWLGLSLVAIFECFENFFLLWICRNKKLSQVTHKH